MSGLAEHVTVIVATRSGSAIAPNGHAQNYSPRPILLALLVKVAGIRWITGRISRPGWD